MLAKTSEVLQAKLNRAKEHIEQFKRESDDFLGEAHQRTIVGGDRQATEALRAAFRDRPIPVRLPILTGEAIQQLRSCLDYLVCALIVREGGDPSRQSQFPVFSYAPTEKKDLTRYEGQIKGIGRPGVRAIIEKHQPYKAGSLRRLHGLSVLKDLSNKDKHRSLLLHVLWLQPGATIEIAPFVPPAASGLAKGEEPSVPTAFIDGRAFNVVDMQSNLTAQVAFENWAGTGRSLDVAQGVRRLGDCVVGIIKESLPFLA